MRRVLNFLSVPIKLVLLFPAILFAMICVLAGETEVADRAASIVFEPWF